MSAAIAALIASASPGGVAADDSVFDRLAQIEKTPEPVEAKTAAERRLVRRARRAPVGRLIERSKRARRAQRRYVPLRGSVERYVTRVAEGSMTIEKVGAGFVPCSGADRPGRCVAVVGDACAGRAGEDCEGMHIIIIVRVSGRRVRLDRVVGGGYYVAKNQDDIEDLRDAAP